VLIGTAVVVLNAVFLIVLYGPLANRDVIGPMYVGALARLPIALVPVVAFVASLFGLWRMWAASPAARADGPR
jgi:hypothetical protein